MALAKSFPYVAPPAKMLLPMKADLNSYMKGSDRAADPYQLFTQMNAYA